MKRPLAVTGISLLCFSIFFLITNSAYCFAGFCVCFAFCVFTLTKYGRNYSSFAFAIAFSYVAAFLLCSYTVNCSLEPSKQLCGKYCYIEGTATSFCDAYSGASNICVVKNCKINGTQTDTDITVYFGQEFSCSPEDSICTRIYIYADDGAKITENYASTLLVGRAYGNSRAFSPKHRSPVYYTKLFSKKLGELIDASTDTDTAAIAKALLLGDKSGLTSLFKLNLRKCGASHIFAVSGMHLSLWSAVIFLILRKRSKNKIAANIFAILFVLFYMALTGFSSSVLRAGIMLITVYLGFCFRRPADALNSLGLSAIILITVNPLTAVDVSFLLSFTATASIFIIYPKTEAKEASHKRSVKSFAEKYFFRIYNIIVLSLGVMLFTVPVLSAFFGTTSMLSPVSSLLCTFPAEFIMITSAAALCFYPLKNISALIFTLTSYAGNFIDFITEKLACLDFAVCNINAKIMLIWYIATGVIVTLVYILKKKNTGFTLLSLLLCGAMIFPIGIVSDIYESKSTSVHIFDAACEGSFTVHTALGSEDIFICNSDTDAFSYSLTGYLERNVIYDIDKFVFAGGLPENSDKLTGIINELFPVLDTVPEAEAEVFSFTTENGITCEGFTNDRLRTGIINANGVKTVYCCYYSADFSSLKEEYSSGDLLICYPDIPKTINPADFGKIVVVSDKTGEKLKLPDNAVSTADTGEITIRLNSKVD